MTRNAPLLLLLACALQAAPLPLALVVRSKGEVELATETGTSTATAGSVIADGTRIRTGANGRALVRFLADQSIAEIKPNTTIDFSTRAGADGNAVGRRLLVRAGEAAFGVTPGKGRDLRFETSTTVASVRGTNFYMVSSPSGQTIVGVDKGVVRVCNPVTGEWTDVHRGQQIRSGWDGISRDTSRTPGSDSASAALDSLPASKLEIDFRHPVTGNTRTISVLSKGND